MHATTIFTSNIIVFCIDENYWSTASLKYNRQGIEEEHNFRQYRAGLIVENITCYIIHS